MSIQVGTQIEICLYMFKQLNRAIDVELVHTYMGFRIYIKSISTILGQRKAIVHVYIRNSNM